MIPAIYNILSNDTTLNSLVNGRIYPVIIPQNAPLPAITLQTVSSNPLYCKDGRQEDDYRLSVHIYAESHEETQGIGDVTKDILDLLRGTYAGLEITKIKILNDVDLPPEDEDDFHRVIDYKVTIKTV